MLAPFGYVIVVIGLLMVMVGHGLDRGEGPHWKKIAKLREQTIDAVRDTNDSLRVENESLKRMNCTLRTAQRSPTPERTLPNGP